MLMLNFIPLFFCVKDQVTWVVLMHNPSNGNLYTYSPTPSSSTILSTTTSNFDLWHAIFEHISPKTLTQMLFACGISRNLIPIVISTLLIKVTKFLFLYSLFNNSPLIFFNVWGPSPILSINGYKYYFIFVDHFTHYKWIYPLKSKTYVAIIVHQYLFKIEIFFTRKVKSIYTNGGTKYFKLKY